MYRRVKYRHLALAIAGIGFGVGPLAVASAADLGRPAPAPVYVKAPPPVVYTWAGFYGGANAGWVGSADSTINLTGTDTGSDGLGSALQAGAIPSTIDLGYNGFLGGGQLGYNFQSGNWVYGLEGDIDWASAKSSIAVPDAVVPPRGGIQSPFTTNASRELDWLGTLRARVGYTPAAPFLLYATGGLAFGQHKLGIGIADPGGIPPLNAFNEASDWSAGWTVGAGVEWMFARQWSLKAEYLYVDLGDISSTINYAYPVPPTNTSSLTATARDRDNIVRGGINYHF
jgi:outer membrane immunogenic protein